MNKSPHTTYIVFVIDVVGWLVYERMLLWLHQAGKRNVPVKTELPDCTEAQWLKMLDAL